MTGKPNEAVTRPAPDSAARRRLLIAVAVLVLLLVGVGGQALSDRFGPIDPTEAGWKARISNDTAQAIHVKNSAEDLVLAVGESDIFVSGAPGELHPVFVVTDLQGRTLGCLRVDLDRTKTVTAAASAMRRCD